MKMLLKKFLINNSGVSFIVFALALPVVMLVLFLAIDLADMQSAKLNNDSAVESAVTALAEYVTKTSIESEPLDDDELKAYGYEFVKSNTSDQSIAQIMADKFSVTKNDSEITVSSCMSVKDSGIGDVVGFGGNKTVCSSSTVNLICLPVTRDLPDGVCPEGKIGTIKNRERKQCPSGNWILLTDNQCVDVCVPDSDDEIIPCPNGQLGAGVVMTTNTSCPGNIKTTVQTSYSCGDPCEQKTENKVEQCSEVSGNSEATGTIKSTRTSICPAGGWGNWIQTQYSCCIPKTETRKKKCPAGKIGAITQERVKSCPSAQWSNWETIKNTCKSEKPNCNDPENNLLTYEITSYLEDKHTESRDVFINPYLNDDRSEQGKKIQFQVSLFKNEKLRIAAGNVYADTDRGSALYTKSYVHGFYGTYDYDKKLYQHAAEQLLRVCNARWGGGDNYKCNGVAKNYQHTVSEHEVTGTDVKAVYEPGMAVKKSVRVDGITEKGNINYVEASLISCEEVKEADFNYKDQVSLAPLYYKRQGDWQIVSEDNSSDDIFKKVAAYEKETNLCPCKTDSSGQYEGYCSDSSTGEDGFYMRSNMGKKCAVFWNYRVANYNKLKRLFYERQ